MNAVGSPVQTGYSPGQSQSDNTAGQTKHWTQSRTVRVVAGVAGVAVAGLGSLAGFALSFFSSFFVSIIAAAAVTVVSAAAVVGYFSRHSNNNTISPALSSSTHLNTFKSPEYRPLPATDNFGLVPVIAQNIPTQEENVRRLLAGYGYGFYRSSRDGNCFYDSIAHQCPEIAGNATALRRQVADFAACWQQCYPGGNNNFSAIEASASARLSGDVGNEVEGRAIATGLEEIGTAGRFSDQIDAFFAAQVTGRAIVIINTNGKVTLAVNENGESIGWTDSFNRDLFAQNSILLVHDGGHFMGRSILPGRSVG